MATISKSYTSQVTPTTFSTCNSNRYTISTSSGLTRYVYGRLAYHAYVYDDGSINIECCPEFVVTANLSETAPYAQWQFWNNLYYNSTSGSWNSSQYNVACPSPTLTSTSKTIGTSNLLDTTFQSNTGYYSNYSKWGNWAFYTDTAAQRTTTITDIVWSNAQNPTATIYIAMAFKQNNTTSGATSLGTSTYRFPKTGYFHSITLSGGPSYAYVLYKLDHTTVLKQGYKGHNNTVTISGSPSSVTTSTTYTATFTSSVTTATMPSSKSATKKVTKTFSGKWSIYNASMTLLKSGLSNGSSVSYNQNILCFPGYTESTTAATITVPTMPSASSRTTTLGSPVTFYDSYSGTSNQYQAYRTYAYQVLGWYVGDNPVSEGSTYTLTTNTTFTAAYRETYTDSTTGYAPSAPTRSGYKFNGWVNGNTTIAAGGQFNISTYAGKTFTASWTADSLYVLYQTDSNTSSAGDSSDGPYTSGTSVRLSNGSGWTSRYYGSSITYYTNYYLQGGSFSNGYTPSSYYSCARTAKYDQVVKGWSTTKGGSKSYNLNGYVTLYSNLTVFPYWDDSDDIYVHASFTPFTPIKTGHSFSKWYTTSSGSGGTSYYANTTYNSASYDKNIILYAIWTANTHTLYYKPGQYCTGSEAQTTITYGTSVTLKSTPYYTGKINDTTYTYYSNYDCNGGAFSNKATSASTSSSTILRYQYEQSAWHTTNDMTGGTKYTTSLTAGDSDITLYPYVSYTNKGYQNNIVFTVAEAPIKVGWAFKGWNTSNTGSGTMYQPGATITQTASSASFSNIKLYAIWEPEWTVKISNGTVWSNYHVWIYTGATTNGGWQQAIPYVYNGSTWKLTSI